MFFYRKKLGLGKQQKIRFANNIFEQDVIYPQTCFRFYAIEKTYLAFSTMNYNMKKIFLLSLISLSVSVSNFSYAQLKELDSTHYFASNFKGIENKIPRVVKWLDETHFLISETESRYVIDALTGEKDNSFKIDDDLRTEEGKNYAYVRTGSLHIVQDGKSSTLISNEPAIKNPEMSPDYKYVAYTKNNDLYSYDIAAKKEIRLTTTGTEDILNGYASWVYYEEILGRSSQYKAYWWSPDSKHIAYFSSDQSMVPTFYISDIDSKLLTVEERTKYPKVGDSNPEVKVGIIHPTGGATVWSDFNAKDDQYFGIPYWKPDGKSLLVQWMNRNQDSLMIYDVDVISGKKKIFYKEHQRTWINLDDNDRFRFSSNGKNILVTSDKTGWNHLYNYDINGKLLNEITSGKYTVTEINFIDEKNAVVYFTARGKENTAHKDLYKVGMDGKKLQRLTFGDYNHIITSISPTGKYFTTTYSNVSTPYKAALVSTTGKIIKELGDSKGADADKYRLAKTEFLRVKSDDGLYDLPLKVTWPLNMEKGKTYPVLVSIYGGPNAGTAWDSWSLNGPQQFYAKEGLIVVVMDHRASGHFGKEGVNYMYHDLGNYELKDYSTMVRWLVANGQADPKRVGITGFSYGGYMSALAVTKGSDVFSYGMAGGSVTDWRLYDSHYTERYMGRPSNNPEGYKTSSVLEYVEGYKGMLQIVHGNMDDNVHIENSVALASKLQDAKKDFEYMTYSSGRHGWTGNKRKHYNNLKTKFIYKYLLQKEAPKEMMEE